MPNIVPASIASDSLSELAKYATHMEDQGSNPVSVFNTTGMVRPVGGDNYLDYISKDILNLSDLAFMSNAGDLGKGLPTTLKDISLTDTYSKVPDLKDVQLIWNKNLPNPGRYSPERDLIQLQNLPYGPSRAATLAHEIQHPLDARGINNESSAKLLLVAPKNYEEYVRDISERRAQLAETASLFRNIDKDGGRERMFKVLSNKGIGPTMSDVEKAVIEAEVFPNKKRSKK